MRRALLLLLILVGPRLYAADKVTIHGYVVEVNSATSLTVDDFSVTNPNKVNLDFGPGSGRATLQPGEAPVGSEVEITGEYNATTQQMKVASVKVLPGASNGAVKGTARLDKLPALEKTPSGWNGYIFADGQKVQVTDATMVTLAKGRTPVATLDGIDFDTFAHYEGSRQTNGSIRATRVEFVPVQITASEKNLLQKLIPKLKDTPPGASGPAELRIARKNFRLVQDQDAQKYVQRIGQSLIPAHQRNLADDNSFKIPFQFYLVADKSTDLLAYPNGVVVVPSGVFSLLEDEAQLAFLLSDAIAQVLERDVWRVLQGDTPARTGLGRAVAVADVAFPLPGGSLTRVSIAVTQLSLAVTQGSAEGLGGQAEWVGMEEMLDAGYDVREAPRTWKAFALKKPPLNSLVKSYPEETNRADEDNQLAVQRSLLMTQLRENYADVDYSALKKDSNEFHDIALQVISTGKKKEK